MEDSPRLRSEITTMPVNQNIIVEAGPGSGKTKLLIDRLIFLCQNQTRLNASIACITYTNAAKDEILERLNKKQFSLPQGTFIGTIHAFVNEYLISPYSYLLSPKGLSYELLPHGFSKKYANQMSATKKFKIYENMIALESIGYDADGELVCFRSNTITKDEKLCLKKLIHDEHKIDQQDTIFFAYRLLNEYVHIREALTSRFSAFLVDEFQDVTLYQDKIFSFLTKTSFFFVGDPNQSIFKFTGADPSIFKDRLNQQHIFKKYQLTHNFRSSEAIVHFNNQKSSIIQSAAGKNSTIGQNVITLTGITDIRQALLTFHEMRTTVGTEDKQIPFLILARKHETLANIHQTISGQQIEQAPFLDKLKEQDHRRYEILNQLLRAILLKRNSEYVKSFEAVEIALSRVLFNKHPNFVALNNIKYDRVLWRKLQHGVLNWLNEQDYENIKVETFFSLIKAFMKDFSDKKLGIKIGTKIKSLDYEWTNQKREAKKLNLQQLLAQIVLHPDDAVQAFLSTIHNAKGREATAVLVVAENQKELKSWYKKNDTEASRIGFVAFSRARRLLCIWCPEIK